MGIGKSSWKEAKEKAKAAGKKIRQKEEGPSPYNTLMIKSFKRVPVKGANEITGATAKITTANITNANITNATKDINFGR